MTIFFWYKYLLKQLQSLEIVSLLSRPTIIQIFINFIPNCNHPEITQSDFVAFVSVLLIHTTGGIMHHNLRLGKRQLSVVSIQSYESVANCPLPCKSYGSSELFKISAFDFRIMAMYRWFCACTYEFLTMVTKGVVHRVHKVVIRSSFGFNTVT